MFNPNKRYLFRYWVDERGVEHAQMWLYDELVQYAKAPHEIDWHKRRVQ